MNLRRTLALVTLVSTAVAAMAALFFFKQRGAAVQDAGEKQWPFEQDELQSVMDRVIADQKQIIAEASNPDARQRAEGFLSYYQTRRTESLSNRA